MVFGAAADHFHVVVAGRQQGVSRQYAVAVFRLLDAHAAQGIETSGEGAREIFRHVLHHHDAGRVRRQWFQNLPQGLGSSRRGSHGDHLMRGLQQRPRGQKCLRLVHRFVRQGHPGPRRGLHLLHDLIGQLHRAIGYVDARLGAVLSALSYPISSVRGYL
jgi:hypothetical protein